MKHIVPILIFTLALPTQLFCQTSKLPLWAAFPEGDTYVGFSFPGGGLHQAELSALTYYCILNGTAMVSTSASLSKGQNKASELISLKEIQMLLNYEMVNSAELSTGETVVLLRIGKGEKMTRCQIAFSSSMEYTTTINANGESERANNKADLCTYFQSDTETESFEYTLNNDDYMFKYTSTDGKKYNYTPKDVKKIKLCNSFPDKELNTRLETYCLGNVITMAFPSSGLWSKGIMDQLLLTYFSSASAIFGQDRENLKEREPELGSYCSLCANSGEYNVKSNSTTGPSQFAEMFSTYVSGSTGNRISALAVRNEWGSIFVEHSDYNRERAIADSRQIYENFIREKLEKPLREWQMKGEFEKTSDWEKRVTETTLKQKAESLFEKANAEFICNYSPQIKPKLGRYDADNEVFLSVDKTFGEIPIKVPIGAAKSFKQNWGKIKIIPRWIVTPNGRFILEKADFVISSAEQYNYDRRETVTYNETAFGGRTFDFGTLFKYTAASQGKLIKTTSSPGIIKSDVDISIPSRKGKNSNVFAVVIGNEHYQSEKAVEYAENDASVFAEYCKKTLGLPESNVHYIKDATLNNILREVSWLTNVAKTFGGDASLIMYYAGHGIPDVSTKEAYLLPVDGYGSDAETGFSLSRLYKMLSDVPSKSTLVLLDACFSGCDRSGVVMASNRGVAIRSYSEHPTGNLVVFSATSDDQVANPFSEKCHGLYTYYLLEYMKSHPQSFSLGEMTDYVSEKVARQSIVSTNKSQTPTVSTSLHNWRNIEF